jgi:hypothetical protein
VFIRTVWIVLLVLDSTYHFLLKCIPFIPSIEGYHIATYPVTVCYLVLEVMGVVGWSPTKSLDIKHLHLTRLHYGMLTWAIVLHIGAKHSTSVLSFLGMSCYQNYATTMNIMKAIRKELCNWPARRYSFSLVLLRKTLFTGCVQPFN